MCCGAAKVGSGRAALAAARRGRLARRRVAHEVETIDDASEVHASRVGHIAIRRPGGAGRRGLGLAHLDHRELRPLPDGQPERRDRDHPAHEQDGRGLGAQRDLPGLCSIGHRPTPLSRPDKRTTPSWHCT